MGYEIKFVPEKVPTKNRPTNPPPQPPAHDKEDTEEDEDEDLLGSEEERPRREFSKGSASKQSSQKQIGSSSTGRQVAIWGDQEEKQECIEALKEKGGTTTIPIAVLDPESGLTLNIDEYLESKENSVRGKEKTRDQGELPANKNQQIEVENKTQEYLTVHCEDGGTGFIKKNLRPNLQLNQNSVNIEKAVIKTA